MRFPPKGGDPKQQEEGGEYPLTGSVPLPVFSAAACLPSSGLVVPATLLYLFLVITVEAFCLMGMGPVWSQAVPVQRDLALRAVLNQGVVAESASAMRASEATG